MYNKIKEQLEYQFDSVAPDFLMNIKNAEAEIISSEDQLFYMLEEDHHKLTHRFPLRRKGSFIAAAVLLLIISVFVYQAKMPVGTVTIVADNTIRLSINRSNKIIDAQIDCPGAVSSDELEGKDLSEAMDIVLKSMESSDGSSTGKQVSIDLKSSDDMKSAKKIVSDKAKKYSRNNNLLIKGNYQSVEKNATAESTDLTKKDSTSNQSSVQKKESSQKEKSSFGLINTSATESGESDPSQSQEKFFCEKEEQPDEAFSEEESKEAASEKEEYKEESSDKVESKETTSDKVESKETTSDKVESKETTSDKEENKETTSDKVESKETTSDKDEKLAEEGFSDEKEEVSDPVKEQECSESEESSTVKEESMSEDDSSLEAQRAEENQEK